MKKLNVKLSFDDSETKLNLELHQQVTVQGHETEAEIIRLVKQDFCRWARKRTAEWQLLALKVPNATVDDLVIEAVA